MNRRIIVLIGLAVALLCASAGVLRNVSVTYVCQVDFSFEYGKPFVRSEPDGVSSLPADEHNRRAKYEFIEEEFRRDLYMAPLDERILKCRQSPILKDEPESRVRSVLSSMKFEVVGMSITNFVYPCRLVLSDHDRRNLGEYARCCMASLKEGLEVENEVSVFKCAYDEYQLMRKSEDEIKKLEKALGDGAASDEQKLELRRLRQVVQDMRQKIDEVRVRVMEVSARRILDESEPNTTPVFHFGKRNQIPSVNIKGN